MLRVVFMGTPEFGVASLLAVASNHRVVAVYTRPDSVSRRGSEAHPCAVKSAALSLGLDVRQPATLRDPAVQTELAEFAPDVIVVAAYGLILPPEVLEIPPLGCINVHASLLPRWRGAAPIQRAILAEDAVTGVSIMRMEEGLDTGPFCVVETVSVGDKNANELTSELSVVGAHALTDALERIAEGSCEWKAQDDSAATYAERITKDDVALAPGLPAREAALRVRASTERAPARALIAGKGVTFVSASLSALRLTPGAVELTKDELVVGLADGALSIDRLRPDGKREMAGADWARGLQPGSVLQWTGAR